MQSFKECWIGLGEQLATVEVVSGRFVIRERTGSTTDLGNRIDLQPLAYRPKAAIGNLASYDIESPAHNLLALNGSVGPSFLVLERTSGRLLEYYGGDPVTRPAAKRLFPFLAARPCRMTITAAGITVKATRLRFRLLRTFDDVALAIRVAA